MTKAKSTDENSAAVEVVSAPKLPLRGEMRMNVKAMLELSGTGITKELEAGDVLPVTAAQISALYGSKHSSLRVVDVTHVDKKTGDETTKDIVGWTRADDKRNLEKLAAVLREGRR
jgi:hypothetical protein